MTRAHLPNTESPSAQHAELDLYATPALVAALVHDQASAVQAVQRAAPALARAVDAAAVRLRAGGRLVYVGAGTSGRLGVLDSVELYPTFSWPRARAVACLAGGRAAVFESVEGAEDDAALGAADIGRAGVGASDVVLLLAASGSTPYTLGAAQAARAAGGLTIGIANNPGSKLAALTDIAVLLDTGAELISGSTRLKAGTAQKIALNAFSSALMVRLQKVYGNLMVDVRASNAKLLRRAVNLTMHATGVDAPAAEHALRQCNYSVKVAIVALRSGLAVGSAAEVLAAAGGSVRDALALVE